MANRLRIRQTKSAIRRDGRQKKTIRALGLRRLHQIVEMDDTPQIRGMIEKVSHLVEVEEVDA
jgi:large subunit ribosomal protein L30